MNEFNDFSNFIDFITIAWFLMMVSIAIVVMPVITYKMRRKKFLVENSKFVLVKPKSIWGTTLRDSEYLEVILRESFKVEPKVTQNSTNSVDKRVASKKITAKPPAAIKKIPQISTTKRVTSAEKGGWFFKAIRPDLEGSYDLILTEEAYSLDDIEIPKGDSPNFKNWQEIGDMLRETWRIDANISEYRVMIGKIRNAIPIATASNIYSGYVSRYEKSILKLENEIESGEKFSEELKQLIREYLLGMKLSGIDPIEVINEVDRSRQKNKELASDLKDRHSSLLRDAEVYLSTIDEYSEIMESLRNL